jgi:serine/threonine protein kinase
LVWDAPAFNGNSDILCYKIDYKTSEDVKWANAAYTIQECCVVRSLRASTTYRFRVSCINSIGVSAYSWASEEVTTAAVNAALPNKLVIDHRHVEALLDTQYNLERRAQQLVLVKKQSDETAVSKRVDNEVFKVHTGQNPIELYSMDNKWVTRGAGGEMGFTLTEATDTAHGSKRLVKLAKRLNNTEVAILRGLKEQDRLVQLTEVFEYSGVYTYVYAHVVPILEFVSFKNKYSEECVVKVLRQLIDAVQWLHLHGFVHLNLSPLSVFNAGVTHVNVKLGGFDNALQLDAPTGKTDSKRVLEIMPAEFAGNLFKF